MLTIGHVPILNVAPNGGTMYRLTFGRCAAILATSFLLAVMWHARPQSETDMVDLADMGIAHALEGASQ